MVFYCAQCDREYKEKPTVCIDCQGTEFVESQESIIEEIKSDDVGFRTKPVLIKRMFDLITLPLSGSKFVFPSFILTKKKNNFYINESSGSSIYGFFHFNNEYFDEVWGNDKSRMIFNSEIALKYIDLMRQYDAVSVNYNDKTGFISFYFGKKDIMSKRSEIADTVDTCPDIRENHVTKPVPFDEEAFHPILKGNKTFYNGCKIKVKISELLIIIKRAEKFKADYYPFEIYKNRIEIGVNDMNNPTDDGAFKKEVECEIINPLSNDDVIKVELGKFFAYIVNNVKDEIEITFAGANMPVWIQGKLTDDNNNVIGKFGYVLPPRTS